MQAIKDHSEAKEHSLRADDVTDTKAQRSAQRLAERIPAYLENCSHNVTIMQEALDRADFEAVVILGHNLRGSGGAFGFQAITYFGAGLEQASEDKELAKARTLLHALSSYLKGIAPLG